MVFRNLSTRIAIRIITGRVSMSAQIPSITVTSIDTSSTSEEITKVCSLETDTFLEEIHPLGVPSGLAAEGDQPKRRTRWVDENS